jgi:hypothetical protein
MGRDPSGGTVGLLGDADCLYGGHIYFEKKWKQDKCMFWQALCLVEIFYLSLGTGAGSELYTACFVTG